MATASIRDFMAGDHRHCDDLFAAVEAALAKGGADALTAAQVAFEAFRAAMEAHFGAEETQLFPAFEQATGMSSGPTAVMRGEHEQMRELMSAAAAALAAGEPDDYAGEAETLLILMQQHNVKEESILYPMCDRQIPAAAALVAGLGKTLGGGAQ
ncbi:hemerythrin [Rhodocyclus purpureus]|nr:hemerythrin [Rhodocyclus purpureus]